MAEVVFDEVTKIYEDGTKAVDRLDLDITNGEFMVLVGPSGCGKTTALRMVAGLEEIYVTEAEVLELVERRALRAGDFYALIPPRDDIHRVRTTSPETSVSIHLLTNDTGCVWRHAYDEHSGAPAPFRSGYVNVPCED